MLLLTDARKPCVPATDEFLPCSRISTRYPSFRRVFRLLSTVVGMLCLIPNSGLDTKCNMTLIAYSSCERGMWREVGGRRDVGGAPAAAISGGFGCKQPQSGEGAPVLIASASLMSSKL